MMLVCDKCNAGIIEGSKFCPQCGDPVTDADRVTVPALETQVANVEIFFGKGTGPNYKKAFEICKNLPNHSIVGEGKNIFHRVELPITEVELLINLFTLVGKGKYFQMLINGRSATKRDLIYNGPGCYRKRQVAYDPKEYCCGEKEYELNIWGCKKLEMPLDEWGGGWLSYGYLDDYLEWHLDKKKIRHELELALKKNEFCPILNKRNVLKTLEKLPNTIDPTNDKRWEYREESREVGEYQYETIAVGIKPVIKKFFR